MATVFLCLGSNEGDTLSNLIDATAAIIETEGIAPADMGSFYESEPVGATDQEWFLNGAISVVTQLSAHDLLLRIKEIESDMGRDLTAERWSPRIIDIDIAFYDDLVIDTEELTIPHARVQERRFMLRPLCDIDPTKKHPVLNATLIELLNALPEKGQELKKVGP